MRDHAKDLYDTDDNFRRLYDKVADIIASDLIEERKRYDGGQRSISGLVAKWAPSPNSCGQKWLMRLNHKRVQAPQWQSWH